MTLTVSGLTSLYGSSAGNSREPGGIRDLSHAFAPGAVTAILGPNGAGKSTLLRLLAGLREPPQPGMVTVDGDGEQIDDRAIAGMDPPGSAVRAVSSMRASLRAQRIAYLPQRPSVAFGFSAIEVAGFGRPHERGPGLTKAAAWALERVGLAGLGGRPMDTLSAGQQQLVSLARVLVQLGLVSSKSGRQHAGALPQHATRWLLADEPTAALDPRHASAVFALLRAIATDPVAPAGVVVVVHDPTLARTHADEAMILDGSGRLRAAGPVGATVTPEVLGDVFGVTYAAFDNGRVLVPAGSVG